VTSPSNTIVPVCLFAPGDFDDLRWLEHQHRKVRQQFANDIAWADFLTSIAGLSDQGMHEVLSSCAHRTGIFPIGRVFYAPDCMVAEQTARLIVAKAYEGRTDRQYPNDLPRRTKNARLQNEGGRPLTTDIITGLVLKYVQEFQGSSPNVRELPAQLHTLVIVPPGEYGLSWIRRAYELGASFSSSGDVILLNVELSPDGDNLVPQIVADSLQLRRCPLRIDDSEG